MLSDDEQKVLQWNLPIAVTLGPEMNGCNREVAAIQITLINRPAEIFSVIDHIIQVSITVLILS